MADVLEPRAKEAINAYLLKWLVALGAVNVIAIVTGLGFIFLVMPQKAAKEAIVLAQEEIGDARAQLLEATSRAIQDAGHAQGLAEAFSRRTRLAQERLTLLEKTIGEIEDDKVSQVARVIQSLEGDPQLSRALKQDSRVATLENVIEVWRQELTDTLAIECIGGTRITGGDSEWSPISTCESGYTPVGFNELDVLATGTVNEARCDDNGCRAWCVGSKCEVVTRCCRVSGVELGGLND